MGLVPLLVGARFSRSQWTAYGRQHHRTASGRHEGLLRGEQCSTTRQFSVEVNLFRIFSTGFACRSRFIAA
jgi:hypothetical protein